MMDRTFAVAVVQVFIAALGAAAAQAQVGLPGAPEGSPSGPTVTGSGMVAIEQPPVALRMHVELSAKGATLAEALEKIKQQREAAMLQLQALKADMKTVKAGNPGLATADSEQKRRMEMMIAERMRSRGQRVPPGLKAPRTVTVSMTLKAEWPLAAASPEELLVAADAIRQRVNEAKLAGDNVVEVWGDGEQTRDISEPSKWG